MTSPLGSLRRKMNSRQLLNPILLLLLISITTAIPNPFTSPYFRSGSIEQETPTNEVEDDDDNNPNTNDDDKEVSLSPPKMPCLFNLPEELPFDRYAACLAATEGLRRARDNEKSESSKKKWIFSRKSAAEMEEEKRAEAQYILNSGKIIKALGLSVPQFNQLGREVMENPQLKERVMEQAYLYRMTATLSMPRTPLLQSDDDLRKSSNRRHREQMFASAAMEIEDLRKSQMDRLCRALKVDYLPKGLNLSDPRVLAIVSPKVRAVCEAFPLQAEEIVRKYGLDSEEFNGMLEDVKKDGAMRCRVNKQIKKVGKKGGS